MRYTIAVLAFTLMAMLNHSSYGQCVEPTNDPTPPDRAAGADDYQSMFGMNMVAHGTVRALVIFAELEYANPVDDPFPNGTLNWPAHQLPSWVDEVDPADNLLEYHLRHRCIEKERRFHAKRFSMINSGIS